MKVFLDDERIPSQIYGDGANDEWTLVTTIDEVKELLSNKIVTHLSLDNDLGPGLKEGHLLIPWMIEHVKWPTEYLAVHSANPYWNKMMKMDIDHYYYGRIKPQQDSRRQEALAALANE